MKHPRHCEHLYEYDPEISGSDAGRMERLLRLREAIRSGSYDLEDEFDLRVRSMAERLGGPPPSEPI